MITFHVPHGAVVEKDGERHPSLALLQSLIGKNPVEDTIAFVPKEGGRPGEGQAYHRVSYDIPTAPAKAQLDAIGAEVI